MNVNIFWYGSNIFLFKLLQTNIMTWNIYVELYRKRSMLSAARLTFLMALVNLKHQRKYWRAPDILLKAWVGASSSLRVTFFPVGARCKLTKNNYFKINVQNVGIRCTFTFWLTVIWKDLTWDMWFCRLYYHQKWLCMTKECM